MINTREENIQMSSVINSACDCGSEELGKIFP